MPVVTGGSFLQCGRVPLPLSCLVLPRGLPGLPLSGSLWRVPFSLVGPGPGSSSFSVVSPTLCRGWGSQGGAARLSMSELRDESVAEPL